MSKFCFDILMLKLKTQSMFFFQFKVFNVISRWQNKCFSLFDRKKCKFESGKKIYNSDEKQRTGRGKILSSNFSKLYLSWFYALRILNQVNTVQSKILQLCVPQMKGFKVKWLHNYCCCCCNSITKICR